MIKNNYEARAQKFIQELYPYLHNIRISSNSMWKIRKAVDKFNKEKNRKVLVFSGASRVVFVTSDYVVKLDKNTAWAGNSARELLAYERAVNEGYEHLFAKISSFKHKHRTFYIMPRAKIAMNLSYKRQSKLWKSLTKAETNFINENISDLHDENWGTLHGKFIVFDYAWNYFH